MKLWKRNAVVGAVVLFICAAVYLNWSYEQENMDTGKTLGQAELVGGGTLLASPSPSSDPATEVSPAVSGSTGYFATARLNRQQARDSALGILQETMASDDAAESARTEAGEAIETLAAATMSEAQIENLVIAKGYADCVAFISDGGVSVVVSAPEGSLEAADTARITEIVTGETGVPASQIKIIAAQG